jgi:hypothetical protein
MQLRRSNHIETLIEFVNQEKEDINMILQAQLNFIAQQREANRRYDSVRREILELLAAGDFIEPGELTANVREQHRQVLNWPMVEQLLGGWAVNNLRQRVPVTVSRLLIIERAALWSPQSLQMRPSV